VSQAANADLSPEARVGKLREAEALLLQGFEKLRDDPRLPPPNAAEDYAREALERIIRLYEIWATVEPAAGYAEKAADWRQTLEAGTD
jgi:hypothetical protein